MILLIRLKLILLSIYLVSQSSIVLAEVLTEEKILAEDRIDKIIFSGNNITKESVLLREMYIVAGDPINYEKIKASTQAIMNLGLYKKVTFEVRLEYNDKKQQDETNLYIALVERIYKLIIPRVKVRDNQLILGVQLRWDNLFGLDHKLRYLFERKGQYQGVTEFRQRLRYSYPNVNGSNYSLNIAFVDENIVVEPEPDNFENSLNQSFTVGLNKWLTADRHKHGFYGGVAASIDYRTHKTIDTREVIDKENANTLSFDFGYKYVNEYKYKRSGSHYGYNLTFAHAAIASDSEYFKNLLFYKSYYVFESRPRDNLNVQTIFGHSTNDILGDKAFILDFRHNLRGYDRGRFIGNSMYLVNMEYMTSFKSYPMLRYVGFIDIGNTGEKINDLLQDGANIGIGFGIRWKIPAFVKVDIRFDVGYGITDQKVQFSLGSKHSF